MKKADLDKRTETHACDCIERQAAIDALEEQLDYLQMLNKDENPKAESKWHGVNWARNTIADLPSAQPERKTGKWVHEIDTGADMLKCSACECRVIELEYETAVGLQGFTYCPYCGAKMEVADGK